MKLINLLLTIAQVYVAGKVCVILYLINNDPKHHSINELIWWVSVLVLDLWVNTLVLRNIDLDDKKVDDGED